MPRFVNPEGVVVNVDDATAKQLGDEWKPVEKKAPAKKSASSKSDN